MRIKCLAQGHYTAASSRFEPRTSRLRVRGLIHWATTAAQSNTIQWAFTPYKLCFSLIQWRSATCVNANRITTRKTLKLTSNHGLVGVAYANQPSHFYRQRMNGMKHGSLRIHHARSRSQCGCVGSIALSNCNPCGCDSSFQATLSTIFSLSLL